MIYLKVTKCQVHVSLLKPMRHKLGPLGKCQNPFGWLLIKKWDILYFIWWMALASAQNAITLDLFCSPTYLSESFFEKNKIIAGEDWIIIRSVWPLGAYLINLCELNICRNLLVISTIKNVFILNGAINIFLKFFNILVTEWSKVSVQTGVLGSIPESAES